MAQSRQIAGEIQSKLSALRASLRRRLAQEGVAWLALVFVGAVFSTLAIDYTMDMERPLRAVMIAAVLAVLGWVIWRQLVSPLRVEMTPADLALLVENRNSELGDRLISAIEFAARPQPAPGESHAMVREVINQAERMAGRIDMNDVVEHRRARRITTFALCAIAMLAGFSLWQGEVMAMYVDRMALKDVQWPQDTYLEVTGGPDFTLVRGDDLEVRIVARDDSAVVPSHVIVHAHYPKVGWTVEQVDQISEGPDKGAYVKVFSAVADEFKFYVTGGDDERDKRVGHNVRLIDRPALSEVEFSVIPPSYMELPRRSVSGSRGVLAVPGGSTVELVARATKDLKVFRILLDGKQTGSTRPRDDAPSDGAREFIGSFTVDPPARDAKASSRSTSRRLEFYLQDTDGVASTKGLKYTIEVQPDRRPSVDLRKLYVRAMVTPFAIVPLRLVVTDDSGIISARASISATNTQIDDPVRNIPIERLDKGRAKLELSYEFDLRLYGLVPNTIVRIIADVDDTLPASFGGPNTGRGGPITLRIADPQELMDELVRRQKALSLEFYEAISLQATVRDKSAAAGKDISEGKKTVEAVRMLAESASGQGGVARECAKTAGGYNAVLQEMIYNRLGEKEDHTDLRYVIEGLIALAEPMARTTALLNEARDEDDVEALDRDVQAIVAQQSELVDQMQVLLDRMRRSETRQDMINILSRIYTMSKSLLKDIEERGESDVRGAFDKSSDDKKDQ